MQQLLFQSISAWFYFINRGINENIQHSKSELYLMLVLKQLFYLAFFQQKKDNLIRRRKKKLQNGFKQRIDWGELV